jgi:diguanylate cyclase (GGDEF)-like protein
MRLKRLFILTTSLLLALVSIMLLRSIVHDWNTISSAEQGLRAMELAYRGMKAAEKASAERGPTIMVLNDSEPANVTKREKLAKARAASDAAIDDALQGLGKFPGPSQNHATSQLQKTKDELLLARVEVDRIAALPYLLRSQPGSRITRQPINQMFEVIDTALEGVTSLSAEAERIYPELALPLVGARYAAELREYAGRLGSQFTAPLATKSALSSADLGDIQQLSGRIQQLRKLIEVHARTGALDPRLEQAMSELSKRYFGIGLPFIADLTEAGISGKPYGVDSTEFVTRYVPEMSSITQLRDAMFTVAREGAITKVAAVKRQMTLNAAIGLAIFAIELAVFVVIQRRVLRPLLANTAAMSKAMAGELDDSLIDVTRQDEIGDMQKAVVALQQTTLKKIVLESERDLLINQLKAASEKDFLTNLNNRRAFQDRSTYLLAQARRQDRNIALITLDIDHFKDVNDRYGHAIGDATLIEIAAIVEKESRETDVLARYGGEEFVILAYDCSAEQARLLAERIRLSIAGAELSDGQGSVFHVTASLGVVCGQASLVDRVELMLIESDRALYVAKAQGRNRVVLQTVELLSEASKDLSDIWLDLSYESTKTPVTAEPPSEPTIVT